ncbi:hypothetical protein ACX3VU_09005, partial [Escherichia coli]
MMPMRCGLVMAGEYTGHGVNDLHVLPSRLRQEIGGVALGLGGQCAVSGVEGEIADEIPV